MRAASLWSNIPLEADVRLWLTPSSSCPQVQNLHSCVQVINDFVSPEHVAKGFYLTQELRSSNEEINYEDKLQVTENPVISVGKQSGWQILY